MMRRSSNCAAAFLFHEGVELLPPVELDSAVAGVETLRPPELWTLLMVSGAKSQYRPSP